MFCFPCVPLDKGSYLVYTHALLVFGFCLYARVTYLQDKISSQEGEV